MAAPQASTALPRSDEGLARKSSVSMSSSSSGIGPGTPSKAVNDVTALQPSPSSFASSSAGQQEVCAAAARCLHSQEQAACEQAANYRATREQAARHVLSRERAIRELGALEEFRQDLEARLQSARDNAAFRQAQQRQATEEDAGWEAVGRSIEARRQEARQHAALAYAAKELTARQEAAQHAAAKGAAVQSVALLQRAVTRELQQLQAGSGVRLCPSLRNLSSRTLSLSKLVAEASIPPPAPCDSACDMAAVAQQAAEEVAVQAAALAGTPLPAVPAACAALQRAHTVESAATEDEVWHDCAEADQEPVDKQPAGLVATDPLPTSSLQCRKAASADTARRRSCCAIM